VSGGLSSDLRDSGRVQGHGIGATRLSELVATPGRVLRGKRSESLGMAAMARRVHLVRAVMYAVVPSALLTGCPPTPLSLDEPDAQPNSPPTIVSVRDQTGTEFIAGVGPNLTSVGPGSTMTLTLFDANAEDTLSVRAFYNMDLAAPAPPRTVCNVGPSEPPSTTRTVTCNTNGFCAETAQVQMNILVCDRPPNDSGPNYFSCENDAVYGERSYQVSCTGPEETL
jgi:hypothetical protein